MGDYGNYKMGKYTQIGCWPGRRQYMGSVLVGYEKGVGVSKISASLSLFEL